MHSGRISLWIGAHVLPRQIERLSNEMSYRHERQKVNKTGLESGPMVV